MKKLAHQLLDDGRVLVSLVGHGAIHVDPAEAKRFAWALLSDLDPEEAVETAPKARPAPRPKRPGRHKQILQALSRGARTSPEIAGGLGVAYQAVNTAIYVMEKRGLVRQLTRGQPGIAASWGITQAGAEHLGIVDHPDTPVGFKSRRVLRAVADGHHTKASVATALKESERCVNMRLWRLRDRGLLHEAVPGRPRHASVWELTPAGLAELGDVQLDQAA